MRSVLGEVHHIDHEGVGGQEESFIHILVQLLVLHLLVDLLALDEEIGGLPDGLVGPKGPVREEFILALRDGTQFRVVHSLAIDGTRLHQTSLDLLFGILEFRDGETPQTIIGEWGLTNPDQHGTAWRLFV